MSWKIWPDIPVGVDLASEFRYRSPILDEEAHGDYRQSQSGETADSLAALRRGKRAWSSGHWEL